MKDLYFWKSWLIFTVVLASIVFGVQQKFPRLLFDHIWAFVFFFTFLTPIIYFLSVEGARKGGRESVLIMLGAGVVKMIAILSFVGYYIFNFPTKSAAFAGDFFILYLLFTVFEIHCLLHNLRVQKKDNNSSNK